WSDSQDLAREVDRPSERGGLGGPVEAPAGTRGEVEARPGWAGARPSGGGLGGPFEAPHLNLSQSRAGNGDRPAALPDLAQRAEALRTELLDRVYRRRGLHEAAGQL